MDLSLIRRTLDVTGWTRVDLARRIGVHKDTVHDWIHNDRSPRPSVYAKLEGELTPLQVEIAGLIDELKHSRDVDLETIAPSSRQSSGF
jgi:transcriptional regulator with XRE-family HTH domain